MKVHDLDPESRQGIHTWLTDEWMRCSAMVSAFEGHAVTFLTTANGGGAAALMAFAGSAGYTSPWAYITLAAFVIGVFFSGATIATGYYRLCSITRDLGKDNRAFNVGEISVRELDENHQARFGKFDWALTFAWFSAASLVVGMVLGITAYVKYPEFKAEKERIESARVPKDPVVNVTCSPAQKLQTTVK